MRTRDNLIVTALTLAIYLLAANPAITGISTHEWISLAFGVVAAVHLALHGDWVVRAVSGYLSRTPKRSRLLLALDAATGIAVATVMVSGLAISATIAGALGLSWSAAPLWRLLHAASATAVVACAVAHLAVHRRWIAVAFRLHVIAPLRTAFVGSYTAPASARAIAVGIPAVLVAALIGLAALGMSGTTSTVFAASTSTGQTLTCPSTGCTATSCHATSGQQGGGRHGFGG
jgi:hypothetical protein